MRVDGVLMREHRRLVGAMRDGHDVHVRELGTALAPVTMREDVMPSNLTARFDFAAFGNAPVKERVVARHTRAAGGWLHVFEKRREAADDFALAQLARDAHELVEALA